MRRVLFALLCISCSTAGVLYPLLNNAGACCSNSACFNTTGLFCVNRDSFIVGGACTDAQVCGSCCDTVNRNFACGSIFNDSLWCPAGEFRANFYCPVYYADAEIVVTGQNHSDGAWWDLPTTGDHFSGYSVAYIGDIDGDGNGDVAVSGFTSDNGYVGDVSIAFMDGAGGKTGTYLLSPNNTFGDGFFTEGSFWGLGLMGIGDVDGDGVPDIAVGGPATGAEPPAPPDIEGFLSFLFLNSDGSVKDYVYYWANNSDIPESFVTHQGGLGLHMCFLGDWTGDGYTHIALGNTNLGNGTLYFARIFPDGNLEVYGSISRDTLPFVQFFNTPAPPEFGNSCATPGDLNGDGIPDLVVGAPSDTDSSNPEGTNGVVWVLLMENATSVLRATSIGNKQIPDINGNGGFAVSVAAAGDLDQNGVPDIWVGSIYGTLETYAYAATGVLYAILLRADGSPIGYQAFSNGSFSGIEIDPGMMIGTAIAPVGDWYQTGASALLVGTGGNNLGRGVYTIEVSRSSTLCKNPLPPDYAINAGIIASISVVGACAILAAIFGVVYACTDTKQRST